MMNALLEPMVEQRNLISKVTGQQQPHFDVVYAFVLIIIVVAIIFHLLGVVLIITKSSEISNQSLLLLHLSLISFGLLADNVYAVRQFRLKKTSKNTEAFVISFYILYLVYILNLVILTLDRLMLAVLNIRYPLFMTRKMLTLQLLSAWIIATVYAVLTKTLPQLEKIDIRIKVSFGYNGFVTCFIAVCYVIIFIQVRRSRAGVQSSNPMARDLNKKYLIPMFMTVSFFVLNIIPAIIEHFIKDRTHARMLTIGLIGLNCLNNLLDPIIYIFFQRSIREKLQQIFCRCVNTCKQYRALREPSTALTDDEERNEENVGYSNDLE